MLRVSGSMVGNWRTASARVILLLMALILVACQPAPDSITIGVVNYHYELDPAFYGLQAGLRDQGFGDELNLIYAGSVGHHQDDVEAEVARLLALGVDALFTMGTVPTLAAKNKIASSGQQVPVVFAPLINPVAEGVVFSLSEPGTGITGVHNANLVGKALEWLFLILPETHHVVTFYSADDIISESLMFSLQKSPLPDGVEILAVAVDSAEAAMAQLRDVPAGATLLMMPTPRLGGLELLQQSALAMGMPVFGYNVPVDNTVASFSVDWFAQGEQASHLLGRILTGADVNLVSVEAAESYLKIHQSNALRHGFVIDHRWLGLAHRVVW